MSNPPIGFSLDPFQALVADAIGEPVRLVLCIDQAVLLPDPELLKPCEYERIRRVLNDEREKPDACFEHAIESAQTAGMRLLALVENSVSPRRVDFSEHFQRLLARAAQCAGHAWNLSSELDEMTDELTERYEELNIIYQLDHHDGFQDFDGGKGLRQLLEDAAAHLQVSALVVCAPDDDFQMLVQPDTNEADATYAQVLSTLGEKMRALTRAHDGPLVLNRADDARRDVALRAVDARVMAAPLCPGGSGSGSGVVAVIRPPSSREFRSHDSKLLVVLAEQLTSLLRGSRDDLTGLLNRRGFERRLSSFLESAGRASGLLLVLDLHNFRVLNETCGRIAGDELLRQTAELLVGATRGQDVVARTGADEFAILIGQCDQTMADAVAMKFLSRIDQYDFFWAGRIQEFAANVGIVPLSLIDGDAQQLLSVAESSCEQAEEVGANNLHVYSADDELVFEERGRVQWIPKLKDALAENRFVLFAQSINPIASKPDLKPHQEILLRLQGDDNTLIAPGLFIPAAERFQLMPDIDRWVVRNALRILCTSQWQDVARTVVWSINLSGQSLSDERFHAFLLAELEHQGFPYENLCFEVTETAAVANHRAAIALITTLKSRGVSFALDDFGTGLSSFAYLKNLPVNVLKIDGNFVKGLESDPFSRAMVDAVNRVGKAIGLSTVAEYVENESILAVLQELNVDYAQGYGIDHPTQLKTTLERLRGESVTYLPQHTAQVIQLERKESARE